MESLKEFLKNNPKKGINDYYIKLNRNSDSKNKGVKEKFETVNQSKKSQINYSKEIKNKKSIIMVQRNYGALKLTARIYRIFGSILLTISSILLIISIITSVLILSVDDVGFFKSILESIISVWSGYNLLNSIYLFILSVFMFAASELIHLLINIEINTRK